MHAGGLYGNTYNALSDDQTVDIRRWAAARSTPARPPTGWTSWAQCSNPEAPPPVACRSRPGHTRSSSPSHGSRPTRHSFLQRCTSTPRRVTTKLVTVTGSGGSTTFSTSSHTYSVHFLSTVFKPEAPPPVACSPARHTRHHPPHMSSRPDIRSYSGARLHLGGSPPSSSPSPQRGSTTFSTSFTPDLEVKIGGPEVHAGGLYGDTYNALSDGQKVLVKQAQPPWGPAPRHRGGLPRHSSRVRVGGPLRGPGPPRDIHGHHPPHMGAG